MLTPRDGTSDVGGGKDGTLLLRRNSNTLSGCYSVVQHVENLHQTFWWAIVAGDNLDVVLGTVVALTAVLAVVSH